MHVLIMLAIIVAGFLVFAAFQPNHFSVSRSAVILASPAEIFAQVNNLRKWHDWSPWAKLDPDCKRTYEGPEAGPGAVFHWDGNKKVGAGSMAITEIHPDEMVILQLEFLKPFRGSNSAEFTFIPNDEMTDVTWSMYGRKNYVAKIMHLITDCDKMIGGQFEKGLENLAMLVEK